MSFTILGIERPFQDLGIKVVKEIRYYNTRQQTVLNNATYQEELIQVGIDYINSVKVEDIS
ncbi:MAG TPA: hypothetical protein VN258_05340 [Mobilitalea sp.]|nr:hypothetical protein [Mobilitalea sp.]